jgi:hypothetical protein
MARLLAAFLVTLGPAGCVSPGTHEHARPCHGRAAEPPGGSVSVLGPGTSARVVPIPAGGLTLGAALRATAAAIPAEDHWRYFAVVNRPEAAYFIALPLTDSGPTGLIALSPGNAIAVTDRANTDVARGLLKPVATPLTATDVPGICRWLVETNVPRVRLSAAEAAILADPKTPAHDRIVLVMRKTQLILLTKVPPPGTSDADYLAWLRAEVLPMRLRPSWYDRADQFNPDLDWKALTAEIAGLRGRDHLRVRLAAGVPLQELALGGKSELLGLSPPDPSLPDAPGNYPRMMPIVPGGTESDVIVLRRTVNGREAAFVFPWAVDESERTVRAYQSDSVRQSRVLLFDGDEVDVVPPTALPPVMAGLLRAAAR